MEPAQIQPKPEFLLPPIPDGTKDATERPQSIDEILAFLKDPSIYSHQPAQVEIRQTHASVVAIASPYVYKVKKAVNLGFLDFTSLEKRKANCEREIRLNSRLCADIYLGMVPFYRNQNQLTFAGQDQVVEWALKMKQLPEGYFLHQLIQKGEARYTHLDQVIDLLAPFYLSQSKGDEITAFGDFSQIKSQTEQNFEDILPFVSDQVGETTLQVIRFFTQTFLTSQTALFARRQQAGWIKDCHGDLHTEHIHLQNEQVRIYDCIEFNDQFRYIDVAADIAFLAMDLDFLGRSDLGNYLVQQMARRLGDTDLEKPMLFYKCYRACVRAKVAYLQSAEPEVSPEMQAMSRTKAWQYLRLALRYATLGGSHSVLMVGGRIGSGKSTIARELAELLGGTYLSSDMLRKQMAGIPSYVRTPKEMRSDVYSARQTDQVYRVLLEQAQIHSKSGRTLVIDATFGNARHRAMLISALEAAKGSYYFIEAQASEPMIRQRLAERESGEAVVSDARLSDFDDLNQAYQPPVEIPASHFFQLPTDNTVFTTLNLVLTKLCSRSHHFNEWIAPGAASGETMPGPLA
jgi:uncharacterized protein